jgi:hypothetical protein
MSYDVARHQLGELAAMASREDQIKAPTPAKTIPGNATDKPSAMAPNTMYPKR